MKAVAEYVDGLPNLCGSEPAVEKTMQLSGGRQVFGEESPIDFARIRSAAAIALHMHQPLIPAGSADVQTAAIIGNLQFMMEHQEISCSRQA